MCPCVGLLLHPKEVRICVFIKLLARSVILVKERSQNRENNSEKNYRTIEE